jgi:hypothetical protein
MANKLKATILFLAILVLGLAVARFTIQGEMANQNGEPTFVRMVNQGCWVRTIDTRVVRYYVNTLETLDGPQDVNYC